MPNTKKLYEVNVTDATDGWGCCDVNTLNCGHMTLNDIKKHLNDIAHISRIPQTSCLYNMHARLFTINGIDVKLARPGSPSATGKTTNNSVHIDISVKIKNGCKCSNGSCFQNISAGKCTDDFMINIIGKRFFADKYKQK